MDKALPQEALIAAANADEIIGGPAWVALGEAALPFPEVELNSTSSERFSNGQEIVVFSPGIEGVAPESSIVVRGPDRRLLGIGSVRAVLARGRTLNIAPAMVLGAATAIAPERK